MREQLYNITVLKMYCLVNQGQLYKEDSHKSFLGENKKELKVMNCHIS